jgi:heme-degrading monooxygenase HmoA
MVGAAHEPVSGSTSGEFVAVSELSVDPAHADDLIVSFRGRLGLVETCPGFHRLEVWQDERDHSRFQMVSWWSSRQAFLAYMRSDEHVRSHARIPSGAGKPRPVHVTRFAVVAR